MMKSRRLFSKLPFLVSALVFPESSDELLKKRAAYVCNLNACSVTEIDIKKHDWARNIPVGMFPVFSFIHPHSPEKLLVTLHNYNLKENEGFLVLVDLKAGRVLQKIAYPGISVPSGFAYDKKRDVLYVADENLDKIYAHNGTTLELLSSMVAGSKTVHLDVSASGRWLAATNRFGADLSVYDLEASGVEMAHAVSIPLRGSGASRCHPYDIKFTLIPDFCCVTDFDAGQLLIVDVVNRQVTDRINVAKQLFGLELNRARDTAYVCTWDRGTVAVIDLVQKKKIGEIQGFKGYTSHCALDEAGHQLVVTSQTDGGAGEARIVDLRTGSVGPAIRDEIMQGCIGVTIEE